MPTASHHGATVIAPTIFKLPADYIRIPHQLQVEGAHTDVVARQIKCQSFLRALLAGEHRAKYVRHIFEILSKLSHLGEITVVVKDRVTGDQFGEVQQAAMQQLWDMLKDSKAKMVTLTTPSLKSLSKLMQLPSIDTFVVDTNVHWRESPGVDLGPSMYQAGNWLEPIIVANLKALDLGKFAMFPDTLPKLLLHAQNLESHAFTLRDFYTTDGTYIIAILETAKDTLRSLTVCETPILKHPDTNLYTESYTQPASNTNFKAFTHLTTLRVTSSLWFNNAILFPDAPIDGYVYRRENRLACQIHTLLPPSLKELEIQFMWPHAVFAKRANYHAQFPTTPARIQIKGCEWFMDLLQHGNELPALERLSLVEVVDVYDKQNMNTLLPRGVMEGNVRKKYTPPDVVQLAFDNAGVDLAIQLLRV